jgi:hypothetical protein
VQCHTCYLATMCAFMLHTAVKQEVSDMQAQLIRCCASSHLRLDSVHGMYTCF